MEALEYIPIYMSVSIRASVSFFPIVYALLYYLILVMLHKKFSNYSSFLILPQRLKSFYMLFWVDYIELFRTRHFCPLPECLP